jgi:hypothetical protein
MYLKFSRVALFGIMSEVVVNSVSVLNEPENTHIIGANIMNATIILTT